MRVVWVIATLVLVVLAYQQDANQALTRELEVSQGRLHEVQASEQQIPSPQSDLDQERNRA